MSSVRLLIDLLYPEPGMQCTDALPDFIIPGNRNMISLIGTASRRDEVREHIVLDAGKKSDCTIRFNSNVRWSTSSPRRVTRHRTSRYYCWVSSGASRHRSSQKILNTFFSKTCVNQVQFDNAGWLCSDCGLCKKDSLSH